MNSLEGVKPIYSRLVHAKILIVDDDFQDTEDNFFVRQADITITRDGVVIKSRLTGIPVDANLGQCKSGGHLEKLISIFRTRKVQLD